MRKEFYSNNNIPMVEGFLFNWELRYEFPNKSGRLFYIINVGSIYNMKQCLYNVKEQMLLISSLNGDSTLPFLCKSNDPDIALTKAEKIVYSLEKGMNSQTLNLYKK